MQNSATLDNFKFKLDLGPIPPHISKTIRHQRAKIAIVVQAHSSKMNSTFSRSKRRKKVMANRWEVKVENKSMVKEASSETRIAITTVLLRSEVPEIRQRILPLRTQRSHQATPLSMR